MSRFAGAFSLVSSYLPCASLAMLIAACGGGSADSSVPATTQSGLITRSDSAQSSADAAPTISGTPSTAVVVGKAYSFQPSASDADGDSLTFLIENKPSWATFDSASGLLSGIPSAADVGTTAAIQISVSDARAEAQLPVFQIQVTADPAPPDSPPTLSGQPGSSATVGSHYVFQPSASDPNGDSLTFSISGKPAWAAFNTASGQLSGTPTSTDVGTDSNIVISVSDGQRTASLPAFSIKVAAAANPPPTPNHAPTISGTPATQVQAGQAYAFTPKAADADGDKLVLSIQNKPSWASFSTSTGALSGTPSSANAGTYANIVISVSDGKATTPLPGFTITVSSANSSTARLHWAAPTTNNDGTQLTNLAGYIIQYGNSPTALAQRITIQSPTTTSYTVTGLGSGTWYFALSSYTAAGDQSRLSNVASKTIP